MVKRLFFWLHKWLGLLTSLIIVIISLTGCIYVFAEELKEYFYHERLYLEPQSNTALPLSELKAKAQKALGEKYTITRSDIYPAKDRTWIFRASQTNAKAIGYWNYYSYYYRVYVNPYNGHIIHIEDSKNDFFQLVLSLHMNLLLGEYIGSAVVGYSVALFVLIMISGLVLWWPTSWKRKKVKSSFRVKWMASPKRLIYDLHNVLGFYMWIPIMIITLTGLVYSFKFVDHSIQLIFNAGSPVVKRQTPVSIATDTVSLEYTPLDLAFNTVLQQNPQSDMLSIRFKKGQQAVIDIQTRLQKGKTSDFIWYYFDGKSGQLLSKYSDDDIKNGEKLRSMNFDLHVGSIGGTGTKIVAFIASLICASLPITGFLMWYNKTRKKSKNKKRHLNRKNQLSTLKE